MKSVRGEPESGVSGSVRRGKEKGVRRPERFVSKVGDAGLVEMEQGQAGKGVGRVTSTSAPCMKKEKDLRWDERE